MQLSVISFNIRGWNDSNPSYLSIFIGVNDVWHELGGKKNGVNAGKFEIC